MFELDAKVFNEITQHCTGCHFTQSESNWHL